MDLLFIAYDVQQIVSEGWTLTNTVALVADVACAIVPIGTGGGPAVRAMMAGSDAVLVYTRTAVYVPSAIRAGQGAEKLVQFADGFEPPDAGGSYQQPTLPGMEDYAPKTGSEKHHFLTNKHDYWTDTFKGITDKYRLDLNGDWNQAMVSGHNGRHTDAYHQWVYKQLLEIDKLAQGDIKKFLELFNQRIKKPVIENPGILSQ